MGVRGRSTSSQQPLTQLNDADVQCCCYEANPLSADNTLGCCRHIYRSPSAMYKGGMMGETNRTRGAICMQNTPAKSLPPDDFRAMAKRERGREEEEYRIERNEHCGH